MGRYSTVQAYADNNANMRAISYEQATGSAEAKQGSVKADKVVNPYGSTAGAGSGEFHVYRHARSREMERWNAIEASEKEQKSEEEYQEKLNQYKTEEEERTNKRRKKRQRQKDAKLRKKNLELSGVSTGSGVAPSKDKVAQNNDDDDEFTYTPANKQEPQEASTVPEEEANVLNATTVDEVNETKGENGKQAAIPNDGSFLDMMKKKLAAEAETKRSDEDHADEKPPAKCRAS